MEDWFQVENLRSAISFESWPSRELRVEKNIRSVLELIDSIGHDSGHNEARATFFILGWIAERMPGLVREIQSLGHEVASHGFYHRLCDEGSTAELEKDLVYSKSLLEDIIGAPVLGYRAPNFSISNDILEIIEKCGYSYDSSYNSFAMNRRYGKVDLDNYGKKGIAIEISETFHELPISNISFNNRILPWGGGGYFRLIPLFLFRMGVRSILSRDGSYLFYIHPWEVDPGQPRVTSIPASYRFRHYVNLNYTWNKALSLFGRMRGHRFISCRSYLDTVLGRGNFISRDQ